jgi:succinate dehydrogenase / fumarate reductase cytochrome b subunit
MASETHVTPRELGGVPSWNWRGLAGKVLPALLFFLVEAQGDFVASTAQTNVPRIARGVQPLRAGQGVSFYWRRLHSLLGIIPLGAFLLEHFVSNSEALKGVEGYKQVVVLLNALPLKTILEWGFIFLPLAFHALYGLYIWWRGKSNVSTYPWLGNWCYLAQRLSALYLLFFVSWHVWSLRFSGTVLAEQPGDAFLKVQQQLAAFGGFGVVLYALGVIAAAWHLGYGLFLFSAKWGIVTGQKSQRRFQLLTVLVSLAFVALGAAALLAFETIKVN